MSDFETTCALCAANIVVQEAFAAEHEGSQFTCAACNFAGNPAVL